MREGGTTLGGGCSAYIYRPKLPHSSAPEKTRTAGCLFEEILALRPNHNQRRHGTVLSPPGRARSPDQNSQDTLRGALPSGPPAKLPGATLSVVSPGDTDTEGVRPTPAAPGAAGPPLGHRVPGRLWSEVPGLGRVPALRSHPRLRCERGGRARGSESRACGEVSPQERGGSDMLGKHGERQIPPSVAFQQNQLRYHRRTGGSLSL